MSQKFSWILAALYCCWFLGLLADVTYLFVTARQIPDSIYMTPFSNLSGTGTVYMAVPERWLIIALLVATAVAAFGTSWARLVWYMKYREAGGRPEGRMTEI